MRQVRVSLPVNVVDIARKLPLRTHKDVEDLLLGANGDRKIHKLAIKAL